jgi:ribonuclease HIII
MNTTIDPKLKMILNNLRESLEIEGRNISVETIQYGVKVTVFENGVHAAGNLYYSAKKRRTSWVPHPKSEDYLAELLQEKLSIYLSDVKQKKSLNLPNFNTWIGTDETGKGDLFGPMVIGGFVADKEIEKELTEMGVMDSKNLSPARIQALAGEIERRWPDRISIVKIFPEKYNEMYPDYVPYGGINGLLGWGHAKAITTLVDDGHDVEGYIIDKFGGENRLTRYLPERIDRKKIFMRTKAEADMAVAAGAILARAVYDDALKDMEADLGFRPHAGSGQPAVNDLKDMAVLNRDNMYKYVKMHFSPVKKLGLKS